ncbi:MAG: thiol:disulfide interchange protein, partial [Flavobacteriaceae bacterium]|nr:thiol:disulfide interchange protein [Flavobacteriaceae bacterium]
MKKKVLLLLTLLLTLNSFSQILDPVDWSTSVEKISDTTYKLITKATIDRGWHLYSQNVPDDGPIATLFTYKDDGTFTLDGKTNEEEGETVDDPVFEMEIKYFSDSATFEQIINVTDKTTRISGTVYLMVCDETQCSAPTEIDLDFVIKSGKSLVKNTTSTTPVSNENQNSSEKKGLLGIFLIAFFSGFAALLTPCVFPMIPMTVSFFTKQSKNRAAGIRNAIIYGISIIVIYVLLGVFVSLVFG